MNSVRIVILVGACTAASCSRSPQQYVESGDRYFTQQKYSEAAIQFANAVAKAPQSGEFRLKLADAYMAEGDTRAAFPEYIRAADLLPDNADAQLRAGHVLWKGGLFTEAKNRARVVLQKDPTNVPALLLLGNSLAGLKALDEAVGVLERAVNVDPERAGIYTNIGVLDLAQGDRESAETAFKKAVAVSNGSAESHTGLGNFYRAVGDHANAERSLKRALEIAPKNVDANQALASLYVEWNLSAEAEPYLRAVVSLSNKAAARFFLADYYLSVGRNQDAIGVLEGLATDGSQFAAAKTKVALIDYSVGRRDEAHAVIDGVLTREPRNSGALTMQARLFLADNRPDEALASVKKALEVDPRSAQAILTLGRVLLARNDLEGARKSFNETLTYDQNSLPAQLELVALHQARGELDTAIGFADQAIRLHPASLLARLARVHVLLVRSLDHAHADTDLRFLLTKYPASAAVASARGAYFLSENNRAAARQAFQHALDLNPAFMEALTGLVAIDIADKNPRDARARVEAVLQKVPNASGPLVLAAKIYTLTGEATKAEAALRRVLKTDPSNPEPYGLLAEMYMSQGKLDEAKKEFTEVARLEPRSVGARTMLGVLYYATHNVTDARTWWEQAIQIDPQAAAPANNLAWLYAESGTNLDLALQLAQVAKSKMPEQPEINDTLGWIYYKKKMSVQATRCLLQSVDKDARNPIYQFHLGMAYAQAGEDAKAGRALKLALNLNPNFEGAAQARKTLALLVY